MVNRVQTLRSSSPGARPTGRQPGELYVNWPDMQFGVINASAAAQDLLAVRAFSTTANYAIGDFVSQGGMLFRAKAAIPASAFNVVQWDAVVTVSTASSVVVADAAPPAPKPGDLWFDSVGAQLYLWYVDGASSQWVIAVNAAGLSDAPQDGSIYARRNAAWVPTPVGMRNRLINGAMAIDQRHAGASGTANGYTVDRWVYGPSQTGKGTWQQVGPGPPGFPNCLVFTSSSAYALVAADYFYFTQPIEANNLSDSVWGTANAKAATLSFWAYATIAGTYGGAIRNGTTPARSYPFSYTLVAATWTYVTIPIPGDTTGTWPQTGNGVGLYVRFGLGVGATYSAPAGAWASGDYLSANGCVSVVGTNAAGFYITGVQFELSPVATPFEYRQYGDELALCQRYYQDVGTGILIVSGYSTAGGEISSSFMYPVRMRVAPTVTYAGISVANAYGIAAGAVTGSGITLSASINSTGYGFVAGSALLDAEL